MPEYAHILGNKRIIEKGVADIFVELKKAKTTFFYQDTL